jgi:uncharacterized membrane protein
MFDKMRAFYSGKPHAAVPMCIMCACAATAIYSSYLIYPLALPFVFAASASLIAYAFARHAGQYGPGRSAMLGYLAADAALLFILMLMVPK